MELLKNGREWFLSPEGTKAYNELNKLGEKIVFVYSYLKIIANKNMDTQNCLFKIAFFLVDGLSSSNVSYKNYPDLLSADKNPFIAYLQNSKKCYSNKKMYIILSSILQGYADAFKTTEWIYNDDYFVSNKYKEKLKEKNLSLLPDDSDEFIDIDDYKNDNNVGEAQLQLVWLFN